VVERITFRNIRMLDIAGEAIVVDCHYADGVSEPGPDPLFRDLRFEDITVLGAQVAVRVAGLGGTPVEALDLARMSLDTERGFVLTYTTSVRLRDVQARLAKGPWLVQQACLGTDWDRVAAVITDEAREVASQ
jgi:hypothetical protein